MMNKIKNFGQFINESVKESNPPNVLDLIHVLSECDPNSGVVAMVRGKQGWENKIVDGFRPIEVERLENTQYLIDALTSDKYNFITSKYSEPLEMEFSNGEEFEQSTQGYTKISDLINELEQIEDKENTLFFIDMNSSRGYYTLKGMANYNNDSYPLLDSEGKSIFPKGMEVYNFMHVAEESGGVWK